MQRRTVLRLIPLLSAFFFAVKVHAQCPQIEAIMIDACGTEFYNEFVIIRSGSGFNTADIELDYDAANNIIGPMNNDINVNNGNWPADTTPCGLTTGNTSAFIGCPNLIAVGPGIDIPANALVVLQNSFGSTNNNYNFSTLCGAGQCIYVISSSCTRSAGGFSNNGPNGLRTTHFSIAGNCVQTITYNVNQVPNANGAYYLPLTNTFGNSGCVVPPITGPTLLPPDINPIANVTTCGSYILPPITGTNLTPNVAYYTGPNGTGTQYLPGDEITSTITLYAFDQNGPVGCTDQVQFTITINPPPTADPPADVTACSNQLLNITLTGSSGATLNWTNDNPAIGLNASGIGSIIFTTANVTSQEQATITITPTQGNCTGTPVTFTITVNPKPAVDDPPNQTVCAGDMVDVQFSGTGTNPTYSWTNSNPAIGLTASGSGDISFTAANVSATQTGTITVTPSENGCTGASQTFTITVNPLPVANPPANVTACAGQNVNISLTGSSGATFDWTNDNPAIGLNASGSGNINFTAANVTNPEQATITVTPTNSATGCDGTPVTFTITVNPGPEVDDPADQDVCGGEGVSVVFTGTGNPTYSWTNNNTATGLQAGGSGNIGFTAANVTTTQTSTVTVTASANGCSGPPQTFTITVAPKPTMTQPANVVVCGGEAVDVMFTGTPNASFEWSNDNTGIGLNASGSGTISFTAANVGVQEIANITVTPMLGNCAGTPRTFTITVNPSPVLNAIPNQAVCGGAQVNIPFNSPSTPTYTWTNSNPAIGLPASGSGNSIGFTAANVTSTQTGTITVTPTENGCVGQPQTFTITVSPPPVVGTPPSIDVCSNKTVGVAFSGTPGATINWVNSNPAIGLPASGSGNISFTAAGVTTPTSGTITVTPVLGGCSGQAVNFTITVLPNPTMVNPGSQNVCAGAAVNVGFSGTQNPSFNWFNSNPAIGLPASGSGNLSFTAANVTTVQTASITVTPSNANCTGAPQTFTITVNPLPVVTPPNNITACGNTTVQANFTATNGATINWTNSNPAIGLAASGTGNISFSAVNPAAPVTATITATPMLGNCTGTPVSFTVTVNPAATGNINGKLLLCAGDSTTLTATGGATYAWEGGQNTPAITVKPSASTTYIVTITNSSGCIAVLSALVQVNQAPVATISGNTSLCPGQSTTLTATGGANYLWNTTDNTAAILVTPPATTTYTVTATNAFACTGTASATVTVHPTDTVMQTKYTCNPNNTGTFTVVLSNQFGCDSTVITTVLFDAAAIDTTLLSATTCIPSQAGTTQALFTGADGCDSLVITTTLLLASDTVLLAQTTCNPNSAGVFIQSLQNQAGCDSTVITTVTLLPSDTVKLTQFTCNPNNAGTFVQNLTNQAGCDSTVITAVLFDPMALDTTLVTKTTCSPNQAGISQSLLTGSDGCDSLVITTTLLLPSDTVKLTLFTCNPNNTGTFVQHFSNQAGCDSTVITAVLFDPTAIDTTLVTKTTCNPNQAGISQILLNGADGCDSLVITTTLLLPSDVVSVTAYTCNPAQTGVFVQNLKNQNGCDSIVTTTVLLRPSDATSLTAFTCDPAQAGVFVQNLKNKFGCDSIVTTTVLLRPSDATSLTAFTCDPAQAGVFVQNLKNKFGCDSIVTTTVLLRPSDATSLTAFTCDPAQAGVFVQNLKNKFGCDSIVTTTVSLLPSSTVNLTATTCDSAQAGVFTQVLTNQYGCDSTIITTVVFDPNLIDITFLSDFTCDPAQAGTTQTVFTGSNGCDSIVVLTLELSPADTLLITSFTCDPSAAGTFVQVLQNQMGCDSVLISEVIFDPAPCAPTIAVSGANVGCGGGSDGSFTLQVLNGQPPLQYSWKGSSGNTGTGTITSTSTPVTVGNLPAGTYTVTVTNLNNLTTATATVALTAPPLLVANAAALNIFNGFTVRCAGSADGSVNGSASGGTPPYQFVWNTGALTPALNSIAAGSYSLTATDAKGCTAVANATATAPPPLAFSIEVDRPDCGDSLVDAAIQAAGGLAPYLISVNGNPVSGTMPALGSGAQTVAVTDGNGCKADTVITLALPPIPQISLPPDTSIILGHPLSIAASTNLSSWTSLVWKPLPDSACAACLTQSWTPLRSQVYVVTIRDTFGCTAQASIRILVEQVTELYIPNVFSPNEDGANDFWTIGAGPSVAELQQVQVFDRWGNLLYAWDNPIAPNAWPGWDGTTRGQDAGPGVYVYYMKIKLVDGTTRVVSGDVTVLGK